MSARFLPFLFTAGSAYRIYTLTLKVHLLTAFRLRVHIHTAGISFQLMSSLTKPVLFNIATNYRQTLRFKVERLSEEMGRRPLFCFFWLSCLVAKPKPHYLLLRGCFSLFVNALCLVQRGFIDSGSWLPPAIVGL